MKSYIRTLSSFGKKKNGKDIKINDRPQMRNPPHHMPTQCRSDESGKNGSHVISSKEIRKSTQVK